MKVKITENDQLGQGYALVFKNQDKREGRKEYSPTLAEKTKELVGKLLNTPPARWFARVVLSDK